MEIDFKIFEVRERGRLEKITLARKNKQKAAAEAKENIGSKSMCRSSYKLQNL